MRIVSYSVLRSLASLMGSSMLTIVVASCGGNSPDSPRNAVVSFAQAVYDEDLEGVNDLVCAGEPAIEDFHTPTSYNGQISELLDLAIRGNLYADIESDMTDDSANVRVDVIVSGVDEPLVEEALVVNLRRQDGNWRLCSTAPL